MLWHCVPQIFKFCWKLSARSWLLWALTPLPTGTIHIKMTRKDVLPWWHIYELVWSTEMLQKHCYSPIRQRKQPWQWNHVTSCKSACVCMCLCVCVCGNRLGDLTIWTECHFHYCVPERKTKFGEIAKDAQILMPKKKKKKSISLNLGKQLKKYRLWWKKVLEVWQACLCLELPSFLLNEICIKWAKCTGEFQYQIIIISSSEKHQQFQLKRVSLYSFTVQFKLL